MSSSTYISGALHDEAPKLTLVFYLSVYVVLKKFRSLIRKSVFVALDEGGLASLLKFNAKLTSVFVGIVTIPA